MPQAGHWRELLNSDAPLYGGSGVGNYGGADTVPVAAHGRFQSLNLNLPPLGILVLQHVGEARERRTNGVGHAAGAAPASSRSG